MWAPVQKADPLHLGGAKTPLQEHLSPLAALPHPQPRLLCRGRCPKCPCCPYRAARNQACFPGWLSKYPDLLAHAAWRSREGSPIVGCFDEHISNCLICSICVAMRRKIHLSHIQDEFPCVS